jgi:hypothetical protein
MKEVKPLLEVIGILFITFISMSFYAWVEKPIQFTVELKKTDIKNFLIQPPFQPLLAKELDVKIQQSLDAIIFAADSATIKIDSSGHKILLTGDSMCEGLMFRFKKYAQKNGHDLQTVIWYGSTTQTWSESDSLQKLVKKYDPDYIFFTTGSNELFIRNIQDREKYIQDIVQQADNCKFIWIGPPNWKEDTGINDLLIKNVGRDRFFESRHLTFQRANDGAHPTWSSAAVWADTISSWIMQKSRHKILLAKPPEKEKTR